MQKLSYIVAMFALSVSVFLVRNTTVMAASPDHLQLEEKTVEVYYFHRNRRCGPCRTIENLTKKTMETYFQEHMDDGKVNFYIVNVQQPDNSKIAQKFNVVSTAVFLNVISSTGENATNLTPFAYRNARNEQAFLSGLKEIVEENL